MACTTVQGLKTPWQCRVKTSYQITVLSACVNAACQPRNNISIVTDKSTPSSAASVHAVFRGGFVETEQALLSQKNRSP